MTDPNWLYSSMAQSTAALVAIVGGFIVSRVIALSSERTGFLRREQEVSSRLARVTGKWEEVSTEVLQTAFDWYCADSLAPRSDLAGEPRPEYRPLGVSDADFNLMRENLAAQMVRAREAVHQRYPQPSFPPTDLARLHENGVATEGVRDDVLVAVAKEVAGARRPLGALDRVLRLTDYPTLAVRSEGAVRRQEAAIALRDRLASQLIALEEEAGLIQEALVRLGQPQGLTAAFVVLFAFSTTGLFMPLTLMALRPVPDSTAIRFGAVMAFLVGVSVLFSYLIQLVRQLSAGTDACKR